MDKETLEINIFKQGKDEKKKCKKVDILLSINSMVMILVLVVMSWFLHLQNALNSQSF